MSTIVSDLKVQVTSLFNYVTDTALAAALGADLPFIGDAFGAVAQGGMPLLQSLEDDLLGHLNALDDLATASDIATALGMVQGVTAVANGDTVSFHIGGTDKFSATTGDFMLAVGGDLLGFKVGGHAGINLGYKLDIGLAYDTLNHMLKTATAAGDEIQLHLGGAIEVSGAGRLGFLDVTMTDDYDLDELSFNFGLNIATDTKISDLGADDVETMVDGNAHLDLGLTTSLGTDLLPTIKTNLVVNYDILTHDAGDGAVGIGASPSIELKDIKLDLGGFVDFLASVFGPVITEIFGTFPVGPLLDVVTAPLPIINDALQALHLAHDLDVVGGDDLINLLDIAVIGGADAEILNNFAVAFSLIKGIIKAGEDNGSTAPFIDLGSITLAGTPASALGDQSKSGDNNIESMPVPVFNKLATNPLDMAKGELGKELEDTPAGGAGLGGILKPLIDVLTTVGIKIPILSQPESLLPLFFSGLPGSDEVKLIEYKIPTLYFEAGYSQFFPIVGPIGLSFGGMFHAGIDVSFGYDTKGITTGDFADGFYLTTEKLMDPLPLGDGIFVNYAPAATLGVGIAAAAAVNVGFAEIAVGGGLSADLAVYFPGADVKGDGKLRLGDITECLFDPLHGEFTAQIFIKFTIGFGPFSFTHRFDIADILLAEFNFGCDAPTSKPGFGLATQAGVNELLLNAGLNANNHVINDMAGKDGNELFEIRNAYDGMGMKLMNVLEVSAFTLHEQYGALGLIPFTDITATMGKGHDVVVIAEDVMVAAHISGGEDDDLLVGGMGDDILAGDEGFDHLIGGKGDDDLRGGDGDDLIEGGEGRDIIDGGGGTDQVSYEHSKAGVIFTRDKLDDSKFIGHGGEAEGDKVSNVEYLIGSHFNDQLFGNPDEDNTIEGLDGNDVLIGGDGKDYLIGGAGADKLIGGPGNVEDGTSYLTSSSGVTVDLVNGKGTRGDAAGDTYKSIEDVQGSFADDVIIGNDQDNKIDGWYGDDQLTAGDGDDEVDGGFGNDIVFGFADDDLLGGGGDVSNKGRDLLSYEKLGHAVDISLLTEDGGDDDTARTIVTKGATPDDDDVVVKQLSTFENLTGSNFGDILRGDIGYNIIKGLNGGDQIYGEAGNDTLIGGGGGDLMDGGKGIDLADYSDATGSVTVNLTANIAGSGSEATGDQLINIENLRGSNYADTLFGDNGDNEIDPGLSRAAQADLVLGGGGTDTLVLDYTVEDKGKGLIGGYDLGSSDSGSFAREEKSTTTLLNGVNFTSIERLNINGTAKNDVIFGGSGSDMISTGHGDDLVFAGLGVDRVFAGTGNDVVISGTGADRQFSALGGTDLIELDGGAGIDGLSISLLAYKGNVELTGTTGKTSFTGVNAVLPNGSAISNFEVLLSVATGRGDDKITQPGVWDNFISTGFGVDEIRSGLGNDFVDGGADYRIGSDIGEPDPSGALKPLTSIDAIYSNEGDLLVLDYSSLDTQVLGGVTNAQTIYTMLEGGVGKPILTNNGQYTSGTNVTNFVDIERLDVKGSTAGDLLVGTNLLLGRNVGADNAIVASLGLRGDDRLDGGAGNDLLIGNTGDDTLLGGAGDDVLVGSAVGSSRGAVIDRGELDLLTGGTGKDTFVLGTIIESQRPIIYYNDGVAGGGASLGTSGNRMESGGNRAIILDFTAADDFIQLAGVRSDYRSNTVDGSTLIYLRDGLDGNNAASAKNDELIAQLKGVAEFDLDAAYVKYVGSSALGVQGRSGLMSADTVATVAKLNAMAVPAEAKVIAAPAAHDLMLDAKAHLATPPASLVGSWVTQTNDTEALRAALFDGKTNISSGDIHLEGDGAAFGTFNGDPFGLGHGIVLSTGNVEDLAGKNMIDGGLKLGKSADLVFIAVGEFNGSTVYRADLGGLGFDLNSLKLTDKSNGMGGSGGTASGFDIDSIFLSNTKLGNITSGIDINNQLVLPKINAFSFDVAHVEFNPGEQRAPSGAFGNGPDLEGSINGLVNFNEVGLGIANDGFLSLGDGGSLGFDLNQTVSTSDAPLYLYVTEKGQNGEMLSTGFTASSDRLNTPTDLSTDLGVEGAEGDSIALVYEFTPFVTKNQPDLSITNVTFDFVFFSEELVEFVQTEFNDNFKISINGVNLALLSDGSAASIDTLYAPAASGSASSSIFTLRTDSSESDFIYNPVGTGPAAGETRADGYSKILHFSGAINPGALNVLRIEVNDVRDGLLDSGILIRGGSFVAQSTNSFFVNTADTTVSEGEHRLVDFGLTVPSGGAAHGPLTVTFHPGENVDLGAGAGHDVTRILGVNGKLTDSLFATPIVDPATNGLHYEIVTVEVTGLDAPMEVAPLVFEVDDAAVMLTRTIGDAPVRFSRAAPNAWHDAWTAEGMHITHTADSTGRVPVYSAVDFGTANPGILSGSDMLAGDLGVSGSLKGQPGVAQDIAGKEAVQFTFDSGNVASFSIDFNRFEAGDAARIELRDILGTLIRTETTRSATFELHDLHGVAGITVGAASGAFVIDSLSVTESFGGPSTHGSSTHGLSASLAAAFAPTPYPDFIGIAANSMMMNHMDQMLLQVA